MGRQIELPPALSGDEQQQLQTLYSYLYQTAEAVNSNLAEIGGGAFTDAEMQIIRQITGEPTAQWGDGMAEAETLKSLIIKTAEFVANSVNEYRLNLLGEYVAEGKFGKYVRNTGLDVDVTPTGIQQNYTFQEIIQGLKTYEINAKNYIKTGLLRTSGGLPVYGVAIGKDIVTFSQDGTETYNDSNKVAELTADELSFWQGAKKVASYKGNRISFFYNSSECFYISNGKIYCVNDLELSSGKKLIIDSSNFNIDSSGNVTINGGGTFSGNLSAAGGTFAGTVTANGVISCNIDAGKITSGTMSANRVRGGEIAAGGSGNGNGVIKVYNASGAQIGKWDNNGIEATAGTFSGNVTGASISGSSITGNNISGGSISGSNIVTDKLVVNGVDFTKRFHIGPSAPASGNGTIWFVTSDVSSASWGAMQSDHQFIGHNDSVVTYTKALQRQGALNVSGNGPFKYRITATVKNGNSNYIPLRCKLTKGSNTVTLAGDVTIAQATVGNVTLSGESAVNLGADSGDITVKFYTNGPWNNTYLWDGLITLNIESTNSGSGQTAITEIKYVP